MDLFVILIQIFVACAMFDVWLVRYDRPGRFRGGDARTMVEEFRVYGLPDWFRNLIRVLKLGFGSLLVVGIWYSPFAAIAGAGIAVLMAGAVSMHFKARDPLYKAFPAFSFFLLSAFVAYAHGAPLIEEALRR